MLIEQLKQTLTKMETRLQQPGSSFSMDTQEQQELSDAANNTTEKEKLISFLLEKFYGYTLLLEKNSKKETATLSPEVQKAYFFLGGLLLSLGIKMGVFDNTQLQLYIETSQEHCYSDQFLEITQDMLGDKDPIWTTLRTFLS